MGFEYIKKIPLPEEIVSEMPLDAVSKKIKIDLDSEIKKVFTGESDKFLVIIGPCSADNENSVCDYVERLSKLQDKVRDSLILVPRIYTNKPRTTGKGYKGMAHQPDPLEDPDIVAGIKAIRRLHLKIVKDFHLIAADEMLYPSNYPYLEDLLGYVAIGARSVENQQHRLTVSGLDIPSGMKNPTSGDFGIMLNSVLAAQAPHIFSYNGQEVKTSGNPLAHCILRGLCNQYGQNIPNYHYEDLMILADMYDEKNLENPAIIVDTSHANSAKKFKEQPRIALEVFESIRKSDRLKKLVKGLMIESYLVEGSQDVDGGVYGKSITDACLGWEDSERLVLDIAEKAA